MVEILKDNSGFKRNHDNGYMWFSEYKEQISKADFKKRETFLLKNIETLEDEIKKYDIDFLIGERLKNMDAEYLTIQEALKNYDKYFEEKVAELKSKKQHHKDELEGISKNFENAKKILLKQFKDNVKNKINNLQMQLKHDKRHLEFFKNVK